MKIWKLATPHDYSYARAGRTGGTWQKGEYKERWGTLTIEWEPDSDVVGDFTWPGLITEIVVTGTVGRALNEGDVKGYELRPIEMRENSDPTVRRSKKPRVKIPYTGPQLWDLWVTAWTSLDREHSTISEEPQKDGSACFEALGVERVESHWDKQRQELIRTHIPREKGKGLFVPPIRGIFRIEEFPAWIFCTNDVKRLIEKHKFTNVTFFEMGDVLEA